jgi:hypothetical protein
MNSHKLEVMEGNNVNERIFHMNWVTMVGGAALFFAPWISGYADTPAALWANLMMGIVIGILGCREIYKGAAVAGLLTIVAPWVLGFHGVSAALWNCSIIGGVIAITDGYQSFSKEPGARKARPV